MSPTQRLRIAIQKKGRLNNDSCELLTRCGIKFRLENNALIVRSTNFPIDLLRVRDDDIPTMVMEGVCDLGIVGENTLLEKELHHSNNGFESDFTLLMKLGFGRCRLSIAIPDDENVATLAELKNLRIATSYPNLLTQYLQKNNLDAEILSIAGSVEIAPRLGMANAICDLVSTGRTLEENSLKEFTTVVESQAVLIQSQKTLCQERQDTTALLLRRMKGVIKAQESKYILFHAPKSALEAIKAILPGFETPTILPLNGYDDKVAVHLVSSEGAFWDTLEKLKAVGASSILVLPIEKMMS